MKLITFLTPEQASNFGEKTTKNYNKFTKILAKK